MTMKEIMEALNALHTAARTDAEGQWWPIRVWMDEHGIFNDDIQSYQRLSEIVLNYILTGEPVQLELPFDSPTEEDTNADDGQRKL